MAFFVSAFMVIDSNAPSSSSVQSPVIPTGAPSSANIISSVSTTPTINVQIPNQQVLPVGQVQPTFPDSKKSNGWLWVVLSLGVIILVGLVAYFVFG